jgi:putative tryptophan/tyrosine transport system substrate-binding protein
VKRRDFITLLGGAAAWPFLALGQSERMRHIGVLSSIAEDDPEAKARVGVFEESLRKLGWTSGRNIRIDYRWAAGDAARLKPYAAELVGSAPDVIFAIATTSLAALARETRTVPIVFVQVADPVGGGFVATLARPGGNITGFTQHEFAVGVKWLELLKEIAPRIVRVATIYDSAQPNGPAFLSVIEAGAPSFGVQVSGLPVRDTHEIERGINAFANDPNGGLIVLASALTVARRELIVSLAARSRLPSVYPFRFFATAGGLASYGVDNIDLYRQAASYVDRILKGEKPGELPVQHATKFELVINLKTAKALGLDPPITLLARTDEVIE